MLYTHKNTPWTFAAIFWVKWVSQLYAHYKLVMPNGATISGSAIFKLLHQNIVHMYVQLYNTQSNAFFGKMIYFDYYYQSYQPKVDY
jgi:hypothetical protein